jgi:hypothetical protein
LAARVIAAVEHPQEVSARSPSQFDLSFNDDTTYNHLSGLI